jgi:hypothetical protein
MIDKSFVATTRDSASSLSGWLVTGARGVSIDGSTRAATTADFNAADLNAEN